MTLAQMLKIRRAELGLSQEQAAVQLGTTRLTYSRWEKGVGAAPDRKWWDALAEWLDRPRWRVLAGIGELDDKAASVLAEHLGGYDAPGNPTVYMASAAA